jgi:hypothetical protein
MKIMKTGMTYTPSWEPEWKFVCILCERYVMCLRWSAVLWKCVFLQLCQILPSQYRFGWIIIYQWKSPNSLQLQWLLSLLKKNLKSFEKKLLSITNVKSVCSRLSTT